MGKKWNEMSSEEQAAHMEYVNSGQAAADWEKAYQAARARANAVTEEEAAAREMQQVILDEHGTVRFRENVLITRMLKHGSHRGSADEPWMLEQVARLVLRETGNAIVQWLAEYVRTTGNKPDMNDIAEHGGWSQKDEEQFAMLIGYSISGAGDLSYFSDAMWDRANAAGEKLLEGMKN